MPAVNDTVVQRKNAESPGSGISNLGPCNRRGGLLSSNLPYQSLLSNKIQQIWMTLLSLYNNSGWYNIETFPVSKCGRTLKVSIPQYVIKGSSSCVDALMLSHTKGGRWETRWPKIRYCVWKRPCCRVCLRFPHLLSPAIVLWPDVCVLWECILDVLFVWSKC